MALSCKLNLRYLCTFGFIVGFSLWFVAVVNVVKYDDSPISTMPQYTSSQSINVSEIKKQKSKLLLHQQIIDNYTLKIAQQQQTVNELMETVHAQSAIINQYKEWENPLSFKNWIKGIGDTELSNEGFHEICAVPNVPGFELDALSATHSDPTYHHIHDCNDKKKWSELIEIDKQNRFLIVQHRKCTGNLLQYQSPSILRGNLVKIHEDNLWTEIEVDDYIQNENDSISDSMLLLPLQTLTQSIWIGCNDESRRPNWKYNHFVSLLPLKIRSPSRYEEQLAKYKKHKFRRQMPNIIIFVVDSTSRSNFHRGSRSTVDYLERIMAAPESAKYDIFQFFRHSTVGWGTGLNLMAMVNGGKQDTMSHPLDLFAFYNEMGYVVPAMEEYLSVIKGDWDTKNESNIYVSAQWDQTMEYTFYLTHNVFDFNCRNVQYWSTESWARFVIDAVNRVQPQWDRPLPYFMVVHAEDNHRANGHFQFVIDRYFRELVEYLNFENTIFHLVADHGALVGTSTSTQFGRWEVTNPISLLFVPRNIFSDEQRERLQINQQRFVTHFDFHVFFKQIPLLFTDHYDQRDIHRIPEFNGSLPTNARNGKMYRDILGEIISVNRSCDEIDAAKGFCFCDIPRNKEVTAELQSADRVIIEFVIDRINMMTGNGRYDCLKLNAEDFKVITHLEHGMDGESGDVELVLQQQISDGMSVSDRARMKEENRILTYFVYVERAMNDDGETVLSIPNLERDGMKVPLIERLDYFKFEECITREYDILPFKQPDSEFFDQFKNTNNDLPPVVFKNMNFTQSLLREIDQINLRLCKCKQES